jgi:hypothetical protein
MNPLKTATVTALSGNAGVKTHPENLTRAHFIIQNRRSNTLVAYITLGSTDPVAGGTCTFSLGPNDIYEWPHPTMPYVGPIKYVMSGAGPEVLDITEFV